MYKIKFTNLALITNEYNLAFLNAFNPYYSSKMREYIIQGIDSLNFFPHSHSIYKIYNNRTFRKLIVNSLYHIIYVVEHSLVTILYVTDARKSTDEYFSYLK